MVYSPGPKPSKIAWPPIVVPVERTELSKCCKVTVARPLKVAPASSRTVTISWVAAACPPADCAGAAALVFGEGNNQDRMRKVQRDSRMRRRVGTIFPICVQGRSKPLKLDLAPAV